MTQPLRVAVLISGTGSNLKTLIDATASGRLSIDIVRVLTNRGEATGLDHARRAGIPISVIDKHQGSPAMQDEAMAECLRQAQTDLVLLSGYMRILGADIVSEFEGRMINQHPSLLPLYRGLNTYERVLEAGDQQHGASIHFVTAELDDGPIIAQTQVPVMDDDDAGRLSARLAPHEHELLLSVMELFSDRRVSLINDTIEIDGQPLHRPMRMDHAHQQN